MEEMPRWTRYEEEILDVPFVRPAHGKWPETTFEKTAKVRFWDKNDNEIDFKKYGYVTSEDVVKDMAAAKEINLSYCYVKQLSYGEEDRGVKPIRVQKISMQYAYNTFFDNGLTLRNIQLGMVNFVGSIFARGNVYFVGSCFELEVIFADCIFYHSDLIMTGTVFNMCLVQFTSVSFLSDEIRLNGSQCDDNSMQFDECYFSNCSIDFTYANIDTLVFTRIKLQNQSIKFNNACIDNICFFRCTLPNVFDIRELDSADKTAFVLYACVNSGVIFTLWRNVAIPLYLCDNFREILNIPNIEFIKYMMASDTALLLKENFRKMGRYDDEDSAYVVYQRHKIMAEYLEEKGKGGWISIWAEVKRWFKNEYWYKLSEFGTNPVWVMRSMLKALLGFTLAYWWCLDAGWGSFDGISHAKLSHFAQSFYHSAVTFLTIGYGDLSPASGLMRVLSGIEGFFGLFLMSVFTVSFMRKVLR